MNVMSTADDACPGSRYWTSSWIAKLSVWVPASCSVVPPELLPQAKAARPPTTARARARKRILFIEAPFCVLFEPRHRIREELRVSPPRPLPALAAGRECADEG